MTARSAAIGRNRRRCRLCVDSVEKWRALRVAVGDRPRKGWSSVASRGEEQRGRRDELCQFPRVLGSGGHRNSSLAPLGPPWRNLSSLRMRFTWAKSISTFYSGRHETTQASVLAMMRALSRAALWMERAISRKTTFGQHLGLNTSLAVEFAEAIDDRAVLGGVRPQRSEHAAGLAKLLLARADIEVRIPSCAM